MLAGDGPARALAGFLRGRDLKRAFRPSGHRTPFGENAIRQRSMLDRRSGWRGQQILDGLVGVSAQEELVASVTISVENGFCANTAMFP